MTQTAQRHLIKKYANRKLYDTNTRRYITLAGISELVRNGDEIEVVDRESGRDLTPIVLAQIVTTEEKRQDANGDGGQRGQALLDYVRRTLNVPAALVSSEVERRVGDPSAMIDSAIESALSRLNIPTQRDLDRLNRRLDEVTARLEALNGSRKQARGRRTRSVRASRKPAGAA